MAKELLGFLAAMFTTFAFLPQVVKVWRTHGVRDISLPMYGMFVTGVALWALYGLAIHSWPVLVANVVTLGLSASVLVAKLRFASEEPQQPLR